MDNKNRDQGSFLDTISHRDVRLTPQRFRAIADYYWEHYCYFSNQRSLIINALKEALTQHAGSWTFTGW